jgi:hypothetical protein
MKRIVIILSFFLAGSLLLSGCTITEDVTVMETTTLPAITTTETVTLTTCEKSQYSNIVYDSIIVYVMSELERKNMAGLVAGFGYEADYMSLDFYGAADEEIVDFVQSVINEVAPGTSLNIVENVTFVEG